MAKTDDGKEGRGRQTGGGFKSERGRAGREAGGQGGNEGEREGGTDQSCIRSRDHPRLLPPPEPLNYGHRSAHRPCHGKKPGGDGEGGR